MFLPECCFNLRGPFGPPRSPSNHHTVLRSLGAAPDYGPPCCRQSRRLAITYISTMCARSGDTMVCIDIQGTLAIAPLTPMTAGTLVA